MASSSISLALDAQGNVYVIELKRSRTPREVVAQALDYGSWVKDLGYDNLVEIWASYDQTGTDFEVALKERLDEAVPDEFNSAHQLIIVASELDANTEVAKHDHVDRYVVGREVVNYPQRQWEDATRLGFVSAGGGAGYSRTLNALEPGNRIFVHIPGEGYVGIGEVVEAAQPVGDFKVQKSILEDPQLSATNMAHHAGDPENDEYLVRVRWLKAFARKDAFWEPGLFANQNSAVKLRDSHTIRRLEEPFGLSTNDESD